MHNDSTSQSNTSPQGSDSPRRLLWFLLIPALLGCFGLVTLFSRQSQQRVLAQDTQTTARVSVELLHAKPGEAVDALVLPATVQALDEAPLYARVNGYIHAWYTDIGKHVRQGEVMATIDSPEVDHQLLRAKAVLTQSKSNLTLATTTAARYQELIKDNSVAQQEVDQNNQNFAAQQATVQAATADVLQLEQQQRYEKITAPFDGVVTQRKVNIGDLVNAGNSGTGAELFRIARITTMRVFVSVPESYSQQISQGEAVELTLTSLPGKSMQGKVVRTDHAIDPATRTLLVEVDVPNASGVLMPGAYGQVHFKLSSPSQPILVPSGTILFQAAGPQVAVVDNTSHVHLRKVTIGRDMGNAVEILSGIGPRDSLIANPPDFIVEGMAVSVSNANQSGQVAQR